MFKSMQLLISLFFTFLLQCSAVPPPQKKNIPELPESWLDTWNIGLSDQLLTISATAISIDNVDLFVLEAQTFLNEVSIITADGVKRCNKCHVVMELHPNILSMHTSDCLSQAPPDVLCALAKDKKTQFLYRINSDQKDPQTCPKMLSTWGVSYNISYNEVSLDSGNWQQVANCGQPRSELNSCFRRQRTDPAFSITLGACPESALVHRQSLTMNMNCIGHFTRSDLEFVVTKGSEYEFWDETTYKSHEDVFRCFAYKAFPNGFIRLAQGIGSDCNGMSGQLNFDTALRTMSLTKIKKDVSTCEFPEWVSKKVWKIIPRGGLRSGANTEGASRQVSFPDSLSFLLGPEGSPKGQKFKCARVVNATKNEIIVKTFTQSQCYGEYHCFHAKLNQGNLVDIHVGAPTPNIEHACLKPSFDLEVPYLLATLVPSNLEFNIIDETTSENKIQTSRFQHNYSNNEKEANLDKIGQYAMKLMQQYQSEFSDKMQKWIGEFIDQVKLLCLS